MRIASKEEFNRLSQAGQLGNFLRTWDALADVEQANYYGWLTIQSKDKQSPHFIPWVTNGLAAFGKWSGYQTARQGAAALMRNGAKRESMYFREVPGPNAARILQFEAMLSPTWPGAGTGVDLCYETGSTEPLRGIRERGKSAYGLMAQTVLRTLLHPTSYDTLQDIWERYPTAIIEATEFSEPCGVFSQRLVVWEVRDY